MSKEEHMTFDEWWSSYVKPASIYTLKETTEAAWEAGIQEGYNRGREHNETDYEVGRNVGIQEGINRKREWVGLTDEDKAELCQNNYGSMLHSNAERDFALVEAKLKEKNTCQG